jgi:cytosine/adenosine deaminase-related metal-dependent hydrolase
MSEGFALLDPAMGVLRISGDRIAGVETAPRPNDRIIDLGADRVIPGLINAHDHLHLNHYPRTRFRERHKNVSEWIEDIDTRRSSDAVLRTCGELPRASQLLQGGLKNLLSGVTTVAHHDPFYEPLQSADFPVRTVHPYGWSHSLFIDGAEKVREACVATEASVPWIIHAGEGVDAAAGQEFETLDELGCLRPNSVLVHGVAFDPQQLQRMAGAGAALVWCPASNDFLFSATAAVDALLATDRLVLGSDSRLSGSRDLLAELNLASRLASIDDARAQRMLTRDAARVLRLPDRGELRAGTLADFCVLPAGLPLTRATRADIRAVVIGGSFRYGDEDYRDSFMAAAATREVRVDGRAKWLESALVAQAMKSGIREVGLEWPRAS